MIFAWMCPSLVLFSTGTVFYNLDAEVSAVARIAHDIVWPLVSKWLVSYITHCLYQWNSLVLWHACLVIITHFLKEFGAPSSSNFNKKFLGSLCLLMDWLHGWGCSRWFLSDCSVSFSSTLRGVNSYPWLFFCELIQFRGGVVVELCILYCALIFPRCLCESCTFYRPLIIFAAMTPEALTWRLSGYLKGWYTKQLVCIWLRNCQKERKLKASHQNLHAFLMNVSYLEIFVENAKIPGMIFFWRGLCKSKMNLQSVISS
jgi:hypothetical protein